ncbi:hypothetical protein B5X24_HaOG213175 [Helicoverpa armigera]|uniref:Scavenger receptor class B member 1 n=1 Tax=Helicoverpa armigera TaxID=29058 RepID=A0A2W1BFD1_HELAM|nr:hypothetical protein B5X24_HaOG213175 [Helicoverpa armigera]
MEKVNIKFHDNDTVTYQHNKILRFVPEMSVDKNQKLVVPNIPLLRHLLVKPKICRKSLFHADEVAGKSSYNDPLVTLAHYFYPKGKRPNSQMGLLLARNGTLDEVSTMYTGQNQMDRFGYMDKINGLDHLPHWKDRPCNDIRASEGSFFPPRSLTKSDIVHVYDKDLCRILPLQYREDVYKDGIKAGLYTPPPSTFESADVNPDNKCYYPGEKCPPRGLQNISPCQYNAPVYLSFPHFYDADPSLLLPFEGLKPNKKKHETYFMIQPKIGVPLEGFVRVQLNLKVDRAPNIPINNINNFPDTIFPVMWIEEGIHELSTPIWRWIYLATTVGPVAAPAITYSMILTGFLILAIVFIKTYKSLVIGQHAIEIVELGRPIRRSSTLIISGAHKIMSNRESSYIPLNQCGDKVQELSYVRTDCSLEFKNCLKTDFVKSTFSDVERESLIRADNSFILSEHRFNQE